MVHVEILNHRVGMRRSVRTNGVVLDLDVHSHTATPQVSPLHPLESAGWWKS